MKSMELQKLPVLEAALHTIEFKIKHLTPYYSYLQVRAWKTSRRKLKKDIKLLKGLVKKQKASPPIKTYWYQNL